MKIKVQDLEGRSLDVAVMKATGEKLWEEVHANYSTSWHLGGPLIQRYKVELFIQPTVKGRYGAGIPEVCRFASDSYLVSAMRCIVASEIGFEIDLPDGIH